MAAWLQVIVEWINCLDVLENPVNDLQELQDGKFFGTLINLLSHDEHKVTPIGQEAISKFIQGEYPNFVNGNVNGEGDLEEIDIASLLLLRVSQEPKFQSRMCNKLRHDTQVKIKTFLEKILCHGKNVTKEVVRATIAELVKVIPMSPLVIPKVRPLKNFFDSPVVVRLNNHDQCHGLACERIRDLKRLRSELEVERFEKLDMQEDLKLQRDKIRSLEKQLQEKSAEMKRLQNERMRQMISQPCVEEKDQGDTEDRYKRNVEWWENYSIQLRTEVDRVQDERDSLLEELTSVKGLCAMLTEKLERNEKNLEVTSIEIELKNQELSGLKSHNEELRLHLQEIRKSCIGEQSFEVENIVTAQSPLRSLNTSEALSSVIDIQLQEARKESCNLKARLANANERLESIDQECKATKRLNVILQEKVSSLSCVQQKLNESKEKLSLTCEKVASLEEEKVHLLEELKSTRDMSELKEKLLLETIDDRDAFKFDLDNLKMKLFDVENSMNVESAKVARLELEVSRAETKMRENIESVEKLAEENRQYGSTIESCKSILRDRIIQMARVIADTNVSLEHMTVTELSRQLETSMNTLERMHESNESEIKGLRANVEDLNDAAVRLTTDLASWMQKDRQNVLEQTNMSETIRDANLKIRSLEDSALRYLEEINDLRKIAIEKEALTKDLNALKENLSEKNEIVKLLTARAENLEDRKNCLTNELDSIKVKFTQQLNEHRVECDETIRNLSEKRRHLESAVESLKLENDRLNCTIARNEEESSSAIQMEKDYSERKLSEYSEAYERSNARLVVLLDDLEERFICNVETFERKSRSSTTIDEGNKMDKMHETSSDLRGIGNIEYNFDVSEQLELRNEPNERASIAARQDLTGTNDSQLIDKRIKLVKDKLSNVRESWEKLYVKAKLNEASLDNLRSEKKRLIEERSELKQEIKEMKARANDERNVLLEQVKGNESSRLDLETSYKQLEEECKKYHVKEIEELKGSLKREKTELDAIRERCETAESERSEMFQTLESFVLSMNKLRETVTEIRPSFKVRYEDPTTTNDDVTTKTSATLNAVPSSSTLERELNVARECILYLHEANVTLEKETSRTIVQMKQDNLNLENQIKELEESRMKYEYCQSLVRNKRSLQASLSKAITSRNELDAKLTELKQSFTQVSCKYQDILATETSICDELKRLRANRTDLEDTISDLSRRHLRGLQSLFDILWRVFSWTEIELSDTDHVTVLASRMDQNEDTILLEGTSETTDHHRHLSNERSAVNLEIERNDATRNEVTSIQESIESFARLASSYESNFKSQNRIKDEPNVAEKLRKQIDQLSNEKKDLKEKLDAVRARNVLLEKSMDELREDIKRLEKTEKSPTAEELRLKEENERLRKERDELSKRPSNEDCEARSKEMHNEYDLRLEKLKQKMKIAYNEQVTKLNQEQERAIREKVDSLRLKMKQQYSELAEEVKLLRANKEQQHRAHAEEINKYKRHTSELSSQLWHVGDRLLTEEKQHRDAVQQLQQGERSKLSQQSSQSKTCSLDRRDFRTADRRRDVAQQSVRSVDVITEEITTYARRHSVKNIQAMGDAFKTEDEEGEIFDNIYLAEMKEGQCSATSHLDRLSILQMRNSLCKPHLKSSYPAETQFHPLIFSEEDIKSGTAVEEVFNDSLSQSLLPGQKTKKKDRSQTSYKRPGPPTPSKNGGRLSLQGNELRSPNSRILKERNTERRTTITPRRLKDMFFSSSFSKRQDENVAGTPRSRKISNIFRKQR